MPAPAEVVALYITSVAKEGKKAASGNRYIHDGKLWKDNNAAGRLGFD